MQQIVQVPLASVSGHNRMVDCSGLEYGMQDGNTLLVQACVRTVGGSYILVSYYNTDLEGFENHFGVTPAPSYY